MKSNHNDFSCWGKYEDKGQTTQSHIPKNHNVYSISLDLCDESWDFENI
jgi:hypothetical protein